MLGIGPELDNREIKEILREVTKFTLTQTPLEKVHKDFFLDDVDTGKLSILSKDKNRYANGYVVPKGGIIAYRTKFKNVHGDFVVVQLGYDAPWKKPNPAGEKYSLAFTFFNRSLMNAEYASSDFGRISFACARSHDATSDETAIEFFTKVPQAFIAADTEVLNKLNRKMNSIRNLRSVLQTFP